MIKLYSDSARQISQAKVKGINRFLIILSLVFLILMILFSSLMDYYYYRLYMIINIFLSILYLFLVFFIYDNILKPLKNDISLNKRFNSKSFKTLNGEVVSIGDFITLNNSKYYILNIKVSEKENKKVFIDQKHPIFKVGDLTFLYLIDNIVVAYGEENEKI
ncbi:MAG: hypothetical protein PHX62_08635 [Bacilli bacterium]|nr:hypothetical protein [Bacilli bacterium]